MWHNYSAACDVSLHHQARLGIPVGMLNDRNKVNKSAICACLAPSSVSLCAVDDMISSGLARSMASSIFWWRHLSWAS